MGKGLQRSIVGKECHRRRGRRKPHGQSLRWSRTSHEKNLVGCPGETLHISVLVVVSEILVLPQTYPVGFILIHQRGAEEPLHHATRSSQISSEFLTECPIFFRVSEKGSKFFSSP